MLYQQQPEQQQDSCPCCSMFGCSKANAAAKAGENPQAPSQMKQQKQQQEGFVLLNV